MRMGGEVIGIVVALDFDGDLHSVLNSTSDYC